MNRKALLAASLALNALLLGAEAYLVKRDPGDLNSLPPLVVCVPQPAADAAGTSTASTAPVEAKPKMYDWGEINSEEYSQYIALLHSIGCPAPHIRRVLAADLNDLFRTRIQRLAYSAD